MLHQLRFALVGGSAREEKGRRRKILRKQEGDRTTLERIVSPGGYGVYALKAFWYYANAIKRAESNMVRARAHRRAALSFPMVSSRDAFEKKRRCCCARRAVIKRIPRLNARSRSAGCIKSYPTYGEPLVSQIASMIIHRIHECNRRIYVLNRTADFDISSSAVRRKFFRMI